MLSETRFGATWGDPHHAAALLRAMASRAGRLEPLDAHVSAACVVAADAWMFATGAPSISDPGNLSDSAEMALAGILSRFRGVPPAVPARDRHAVLSTSAVAMAEAAAERVAAWNLDPLHVLSDAAGMLAHGEADDRIATAAAALEAAADGFI